MCGICGIVTSRLHAKRFVPFLGRMADSMRHRGPDGMRIALTDVGAFCHLRLAIVDVEGGAQPIYNEDGSIGVVFNGEIYNYPELREFLESKGHTFKTKTDTEVIVHLFEQYGEKAFEKLLGMFAFALWTPTQVYLVRDQVGIKPLYYYIRDNEVLFCSEIKGVLSTPGLDLSFDPEGISQYLTFRYCPAENTIFSRIKRLPAAHYMKIENGRSQKHKYFSLTEDMGRQSLEDGDEELLNSMLEVVKSHLMGEVPIGLTLSGGIDSSSIAYFINRLGATLETYNIGFPSVNEFPYSEAVARHFGLNHTIVEMNPNELIGYLPKYIQAIDEPIADAACLPLYKLCETMKKKVTVVLSGEGGDEIFAGYPQYRQVTDMFNANSSQAFEYFLAKSFYFVNGEGHIVSAVRGRFPHRDSFVGTLLNAMLLYDLHTWVPENLMMKADKVLMFHSLEGRFPFLDLRVMRAAFALPDDQKLHPSGESKWALKKLMSGPLPDVVLHRPKMGFTVPIGELLWQSRDTVHDVIASVSALDSILDRKELHKTVESHYSGDQDSSLLVWTVFVLYFWLHHYFGTAGRPKDS